MQKKGAIYRMTMFTGVAIIGLQAFGETIYSGYYKAERNQEIEQEKKNLEKIKDFTQVEDGENDDGKASGGLLSSR